MLVFQGTLYLIASIILYDMGFRLGLALHTFHGNCFVRSTDLLALPNVNPDHSFAIQISYEDSLEEMEVAFLQSALLYTSVRGERRIRVATIALPVTSVSD